MKLTCTESCLVYLKHSRTEKETIEYLKSCGYVDDEINESIEYAKSLGYIDDEDYCNAYVNDHVIVNKWGPTKIKFMLKEKGITGSIVDFALMDNEERIHDNMLNAIRKKAKGLDLDDYKSIQKIINNLISKGYLYEPAKKALNEFRESR